MPRYQFPAGAVLDDALAAGFTIRELITHGYLQPLPEQRNMKRYTRDQLVEHLKAAENCQDKLAQVPMAPVAHWPTIVAQLKRRLEAFDSVPGAYAYEIDGRSERVVTKEPPAPAPTGNEPYTVTRKDLEEELRRAESYHRGVEASGWAYDSEPIQESAALVDKHRARLDVFKLFPGLQHLVIDPKAK